MTPSKSNAKFIWPALILLLSGAGVVAATTLPHSMASASPPASATQAPIAAPAVEAPRPSVATTPAVVEATHLGEAFSQVAEGVSPAVVTIRIEAQAQHGPMPEYGPFGFSFGGSQEPEVQHGMGSGMIISADGAILTNNHVVNNATRLEVVLRDGRSFLARVVGTDPATDLAVIKIQAQNLPFVSFADSTHARVGEWVVAIGSPLGLDYTVTAGVLSATGRGGLGMQEIEDFLQTDASINPGNSGGPLVNLRGEVLGVNTMIAGRGTGIGFAVPAAIARNVSQQLLQSGSVRRSQIGVVPQELSTELASNFGVAARAGVLLGEVLPGSPANEAHLEAGDIVTAIDGMAVHTPRELSSTVMNKPIGSNVTLSVLRQGHPITAVVRTSERPTRDHHAQVLHPVNQGNPRWIQTPGNELGFMFAPIDMGIAQRLPFNPTGTIVVTRVEQGSPAERAGLHPGDVILEADHQQIQTPVQLDAALRDGRALLRIERRDGRFFTALTRDEVPTQP